MERIQKEKLVEGLKGEFSKAKAVYLARFIGLTVTGMDDLRNKVRTSGGNFQVIKNTLAKLGTEGSDFEDLAGDLAGPYGWAYTENDPVELAKVLKEFNKDHEVFDLEKGMFEGKALDTKDIEALAAMPSKEVLLAQLLSAMNGPATGMVNVIQAVPRQLVTVIDQIRKKKEEESNNG